MLPAIVDPVAPVTLLSMAESRPGCLNLTVLPAPTEKLCQLMTARFDCWLIERDRPPVPPIVAEPCATVPPWGRDWAREGPELTATRPRPARRATQETLERSRTASIIPPPNGNSTAFILYW